MKSLPGQCSDRETEAQQCKAARGSCKDPNETMPSPHSVTSCAPQPAQLPCREAHRQRGERGAGSHVLLIQAIAHQMLTSSSFVQPH